MSGNTVGEGVEQHRPFLLLQHIDLALEGVDDSQRVVAVDAFAMHLVAIGAGADACHDFLAHGFAKSLTAHAVEVVHDVDDQRQPAFELAFPQLLVLPHRGHADRFPDRPATHRCIADITDDDAGLLIDFLEQ